MPIIILFCVLAVAVLIWFTRKRLRQARLQTLVATPLEARQITLLQEKVGLYPLLPESLRLQLHGLIQIFLDEKKFISRGVEITDEVKITIAGNACLLLLQSNKKTFPGFTSILVYPETYVAHQTTHDGALQTKETSRRAGESWMRGPIVLSWSDVVRGSVNANDGHNVVIHEFAHKLDEQTGQMDGLPLLREQSHYAEWSKILGAEYISLQERAKRRKNKVLDTYGTVSPPEFFAVATESFFEKPRQMKSRLPDLYHQLKTFYQLDPEAWRQL